MFPWHKVTINPISLSAIESLVPVLIYLCVTFSSEKVTTAQNLPISNFEGMGALLTLAVDGSGMFFLMINKFFVVNYFKIKLVTTAYIS
jgi:hypothetical protein